MTTTNSSPVLAIATRADAVRVLRNMYRHADLEGAATPSVRWNVIAALENALAQDSQAAFEDYLSAARDAVRGG